MKVILFLLCGVICFSNPEKEGSCQEIDNIADRDTTIIAKLIDTDSIFLNQRNSYFGVKIYYGVHHIKVACINIKDNSKGDTLILAYVYNNTSEHRLYMKNFNLKIGTNYIFNIVNFKPCQSDFPRIQGRCDDSNLFFPESKKLIQEYRQLFRIINVYPYTGRKS